MTLQIPLSPDTEQKLRGRAAATGEDIASYVARILDEALRKPTLDEILAPLRDEVEQSGMNDEQLGQLLERTKHDLRRSRRASA